MQHFDMVLALARMALNGDQKRVEGQLGRLRDALKESDTKQADKLTRLIARKERRQEVAPMALERMRAADGNAGIAVPGETLSRSTPLPVDKETGSPLARIVFPEDRSEQPPIFGVELESAIADLLREWDRLEDLARIGVQPNTRCLIYGAPGVGKTMLARHIARELALPLVEARLDGLVSSFLGTTARNIGALFLLVPYVRERGRRILLIAVYVVRDVYPGNGPRQIFTRVIARIQWLILVAIIERISP